MKTPARFNVTSYVHALNRDHKTVRPLKLSLNHIDCFWVFCECGGSAPATIIHGKSGCGLGSRVELVQAM